MNGVTSIKKPVVPKGSTLDPLLLFSYQWFIFCLQHTFSILFAGGTNLFSSGKEIINNGLSQIFIWLKVNKLSRNIKKTQYMIFHECKKRCLNVKLSIDGEPINDVYKTKFLGVVTANRLTWKLHIAYASGKIAHGIGMIFKARQYLNKERLISFYFYFHVPSLTHCNHIWDSTYKNKSQVTRYASK